MKTIKSVKTLSFCFFLVVVSLNSCGSDAESTSTEKNEVKIDSSLLLSKTSPHDFGTSIINFKKQLEAATVGFEIQFSTGYVNSDSSFFIVNFIEYYEQGHFVNNYSIAVNSDSIIEINENYSRVEDYDIQNLLYQNDIKFAFFRGLISESLDLTLDGSNDFLLVNTTNFKTDFNEMQQIILFDGINKLIPTKIIALSSYTTESDEWEGIVGEKETLKFIKNKNATPTIVLEHYNDDYNGEPASRTHIDYNLKWKWNTDNITWDLGIECVNCGSYFFSHYTDKLPQLIQDGEAYMIQENCYKGGEDFFQLEKFESDLSNYYAINTNSDESGYMIVLHIAEINENYSIMYVASVDLYYEVSNIEGFHIMRKSFEKWEVYKNIDSDFPDVMKIGPMGYLYTNTGFKYSKTNCQ